MHCFYPYLGAKYNLTVPMVFQNWSFLSINNQTNLNFIKGDSAFLSYNGVKVKLEAR